MIICTMIPFDVIHTTKDSDTDERQTNISQTFKDPNQSEIKSLIEVLNEIKLAEYINQKLVKFKEKYGLNHMKSGMKNHFPRFMLHVLKDY